MGDVLRWPAVQLYGEPGEQAGGCQLECRVSHRQDGGAARSHQFESAESRLQGMVSSHPQVPACLPAFSLSRCKCALTCLGLQVSRAEEAACFGVQVRESRQAGSLWVDNMGEYWGPVD